MELSTFATLGLAVGAGTLSFASPCVLPLLPAYLASIAGSPAEEATGARDAGRGRALLHGASFTLGLALVFTALGASASAVGQLLGEHLAWLLRGLGLLVVVLGLHLLGVLRIPLLYRSARLERPGGGARSPGGAFLLGAAFGAGWTPCIGPLLAGALVLASQEATAAQGALTLLAFSLGLGVPFVLAGLATGAALHASRSLRQHLVWLERAGGVVLVVMGLLVFSDRLSLLSAWLIQVLGPGWAL